MPIVTPLSSMRRFCATSLCRPTGPLALPGGRFTIGAAVSGEVRGEDEGRLNAGFSEAEAGGDGPLTLRPSRGLDKTLGNEARLGEVLDRDDELREGVVVVGDGTHFSALRSGVDTVDTGPGGIDITGNARVSTPRAWLVFNRVGTWEGFVEVRPSARPIGAPRDTSPLVGVVRRVVRTGLRTSITSYNRA